MLLDFYCIDICIVGTKTIGDKYADLIPWIIAVASNYTSHHFSFHHHALKRKKKNLYLRIVFIKW